MWIPACLYALGGFADTGDLKIFVSVAGFLDVIVGDVVCKHVVIYGRLDMRLGAPYSDVGGGGM